MNSRLAVDASGRLTVIVTTPDGGLPVGFHYRVLGNLLTTATPGDPMRWAFLEERAGHHVSGPLPRRKVEPPRDVVCGVCGVTFELSARNARNGNPICASCRGQRTGSPAPTAAMRAWWTTRYTREELSELAAFSA